MLIPTNILDPCGFARRDYKTVLTLNDGEVVNGMTHSKMDNCVYAATTEGVYKINEEGIVEKLDGTNT